MPLTSSKEDPHARRGRAYQAFEARELPLRRNANKPARLSLHTTVTVIEPGYKPSVYPGASRPGPYLGQAPVRLSTLARAVARAGYPAFQHRDRMEERPTWRRGWVDTPARVACGE